MQGVACGLKINYDKTWEMVFYTNLELKQSHLSQLVSNTGVQIQQVPTIKILGATLIASIRWVDHVTSVIFSASGRLLFEVAQTMRILSVAALVNL